MGRKKKEEPTNPKGRGLPWRGDATIRGVVLSPCGNAHIEDREILFPWPEDPSFRESGADALTSLLIKGWDTVQATGPLLPRFLCLIEATDDEVFSFANQWGPLWWSGDPMKPFFRPGKLDRHKPLFRDVEWQREKIWQWKGTENVRLFSSAATLLSFLIRVALGLRRDTGIAGSKELAETVSPFLVPGVFGAISEDISRLDSALAIEVLEEMLQIGNFGGDCGEEASLNLLISDGFFPIVVAETIIAITKERERFFVCDGCGRLYFRDWKLPGKEQLNFCEKCTIGGRVAKRLYARKIRASKAE